MRNALTSASTLWRNAPLRRLQIAALLSGTSGFGYGTALFVWAFRSGGPSSVGVAGMAVLAPAALLAPFAAVVGDRGRRDRTLAALAGVRAILLLATAVAMVSSAPSPVVYAVAALAAVPTRVYYPVQSALLPSLARSDRELAAANALAGAVENVAILAGPGLAGALLAFAAPATVVTLAAVVSALVGLLVRDLGQVAREREEPQHARRDVLAGVATIARNSSLALIVGLFAVETLLVGILTVAVVALAIEDLALGSGGVGLLNASVGSGGVLGGAIALSLAARARHGSNLRLASIGWSLPLALLAILPGLPAAHSSSSSAPETSSSTWRRTPSSSTPPPTPSERASSVLSRGSPSPPPQLERSPAESSSQTSAPAPHYSRSGSRFPYSRSSYGGQSAGSTRPRHPPPDSNHSPG